MSENIPLEKRAGRNIGIEPGTSPFLQGAGGREKELLRPIGSETVILECPVGVARNLNVAGETGSSGMIFNNGAAYFYDVLFRDASGSEIVLTAGSVLANAQNQFAYGVDVSSFVLTPGEKIVIRSVVDPTPPPV